MITEFQLKEITFIYDSVYETIDTLTPEPLNDFMSGLGLPNGSLSVQVQILKDNFYSVRIKTSKNDTVKYLQGAKDMILHQLQSIMIEMVDEVNRLDAQ